MGQKEPVKITLSEIFRWIFGLYFLVIAAGMVTGRKYVSADLINELNLLRFVHF